MDIHEYQAKALFKQFGVNIPFSRVADLPEKVFETVKSGPPGLWLIKAQIHAGGRGLSGGIKKARDPGEARKIAKEMIGRRLITPQTGSKGHIVHQVLVESACDIEREFYLSLLLDRSSQQLCLMLSLEGGMTIEETAKKNPEKIFKTFIDPVSSILPFQVLTAVKKLGLELSFVPKMDRLLKALCDLMIKKEALLIEINPLARTKIGELLPLDAKMSLDDNALFRQEDIKAFKDLKSLPSEEKKAQACGLSFVKLSGNIGCLVNGAGLAMATMDIVQLQGGAPANFLDVGGGVDSQKIDTAFQILKEDPDVKGILVNIFGGIVKCDLIAEGLIKAISQLNIKVPVVVRLEGTHALKARRILDSSGRDLVFAEDLKAAAKKIVSLVEGT